MSDKSTILVRVPNWLGDCVMALPVFRLLRKAFPESHLIAASRPHLAGCFEAHDDVDEVVHVPHSGGIKSLVSLWSQGGALASRKIDTGILLTNSFSTAFWMWRTKAKKRIGFARDGRSFFLTDAITATPELHAAHQADYYLHLCGVLGASTERLMPELKISKAGIDSAKKVLSDLSISGEFTAIAPLSAYGSVKDWSAENYAEVARRIASRGRKVIILGVPSDAAGCQKIADIAGDNVISAAGKTDLAGFMGVISLAHSFIGGDSGGAHAAAALSVPTAAIFGITEPSRTHALGPFLKNVGRGGHVTPDLSDPVVRAAAKLALEEITPDEVLQASDDTVAMKSQS